jgi:glycosyltransferase involved in cell wall biosynthesis
VKVALIYDRINKFGGAERLLTSLKKIYPHAPIFTLVHSKKDSQWAAGFKVIASPINRFKNLRQKHQWLSPLAPMMFETFDLTRFDLVISLTSESAKAVITKPETLHLCYCLTPTRYLWGNIKEYSQDIKMKILPKKLKGYFKKLDLTISKRPDQYLAISNEVKRRIKKFYSRPSSVVYPPIQKKFSSNTTFKPLDQRRYYLVVSRQVPYKKTDLVIKTFITNTTKLGKTPLKIVGTGSQLKKLRKLAKPSRNIKFLGQVSDEKLIHLYQNAKAVIFPQIEDYGLVPLEAQASGTPVIAFNKGGAKETVKNNQTGIFFNHQTPTSLLRAITIFESRNHQITPQKCFKNALKFSQDRFVEEFHDKVNKLWLNHQKNLST